MIFAIQELEQTGLVRAIYTTKERHVWRFDGENGPENFEYLTKELGGGIKPEDLTRVYQSHTDKVKIVTRKHAGEMVTRPNETEDCDGMITDEKGLMLCTVEADCVPVYMLDPVTPAIGMVHSGWRGTAKQIAVKAIKLMEKEYGSKPEDMMVALGPHICGNCYEVGEELREDFKELFEEAEREKFLTQKPDGKLNLDLSKAMKAAVMRAGVKEENFFDSCPCTKESDKLCSWRRDNPIRQSMLTGIMLVK